MGNKTTLIIYFDHTLKNRQIIRPVLDGKDKFQGDWNSLAAAICPNYYRIQIV